MALVGKLKPSLNLGLLGLFLAVLASLQLMSSATHDASALSGMYSGLVLVNSLGTVIMLGLVIANAWWLYRQLSKKAAGSSLTARMVGLFILLTLAPASIVFYHSMRFIQQSIDSWFDVRIDQAMDDALKLGQAAVDERMSNDLRKTEEIAEQLRDVSEASLAFRLDEVRGFSDEAELTVFNRQGRIIAYGGNQSAGFIPDLPEAGILLRVSPGKPYFGIEPAAEEGMQVRVVTVLPNEEMLYLQGIYGMPMRLSGLAHTVEGAYVHYREMNYLRASLKSTFALTLSLVLLLSLLAAIWAAFLSIRRIVAPVRYLARGTRAVAEGNYAKRLPVRSRDELGFLVESFNAMTEKIAAARDEAQHSRQEVERQRAYLDAVLTNLSSGVLSLDRDARLLTANQTADQILHGELAGWLDHSVENVGTAHPHLRELCSVVARRVRAGRVRAGREAWEETLAVQGPGGHQELLCRGTPLLDAEGVWQGVVLVIDDVTALIQAQRVAAWSEVARRLAHEIKNPLTPIQLSAERLRHKLAKSLGEEDGEVLDKATRTIVQQVEAMKTMVNAFAEYAKPSIGQLQPLALDGLIEAVAALYPPASGVEIELDLDRNLPQIMADATKLRQVLHNLIKNSVEAMASGAGGAIHIGTRRVVDASGSVVEIEFRDNGPGIPADQADRIFEPYVTTKSKGTGLGLAIVKKIIEEHGGSIKPDLAWREGARFLIRLPLLAAHFEVPTTAAEA